MYIPNTKALGRVVSEKNIISCFPYISLIITGDHRGSIMLGPRVII